MERKRPSMPTPLTMLYFVGILVLVGALLLTVPTLASANASTAPLIAGYVVGVSISGFVPALITHAIVAAIYDTKWKRTGWLDD